VESKCVELADFERLEKDHEELKAQLAALTAVVGGITTAGAVDFQRLEECVEFALKGVRLGARPVLLAKAAAVLEDLEEMQKALKIEKRKNRGLKAARPKSPSSRAHG
jgi:hypothetical protein